MSSNPYEAPAESEAAYAEPDVVVRFEQFAADPEAIHAAGRLRPADIRRGLALIYPWSTRRVVSVLLHAALAALGIWYVLKSPPMPVGSSLAFGIAVYGVFSIYRQFAFSRSLTNILLRHTRGPWRYHEGVFASEYCESRGPVQVTRWSWDAFKGWRRRNDVVVLLLDQPIPMGLIVARAGFASEEDWQRFLDLVERRLGRG